MKFKCNCTMKERVTGDGCHVCNTEFAIALLPQPAELASQLTDEGLTEGQAYFVANEIFRPLVSLIYTLNDKVDQLAEKL